MRVGSALQELGGFLEECERREGVLAVETVDCIELAQPGRAEATVELTLDLRRANGDGVGFRARDTEVRDDGSLGFDVLSAGPILPEGDYDLQVNPLDASLEPSGTVVVTLSLSMADGERTRAGSASPERDGPTTDRRDRDVPPFEDTDLLAGVYESCDTFREMADELEMDVTAETVRRYMVDHDIHEPNSYDTATSSDGDREANEGGATPARGTDAGQRRESGDRADEDRADSDPEDRRDAPPVRADGIGLPEDVTVDTLIETVRRSNTIYEFKREVGLERDAALDMLRELHLLEFFTGRLDSRTGREITRGDVVERLREASERQ
jgi:hypothetical protein